MYSWGAPALPMKQRYMQVTELLHAISLVRSKATADCPTIISST
jgi:hypothetical protein